MALITRTQRHTAGDFDDSNGTIKSRNKEATNPAITRGQVLSSNGGTQLRVAVAADRGPIYVANSAKALNVTYVDALWGDDVIFYVTASGAIPANSELECAANGRLAASAGVNPRVAKYVKHGTRSNDPVTPLGAAADGDIIGVILVNNGQG